VAGDVKDAASQSVLSPPFGALVARIAWWIALVLVCARLGFLLMHQPLAGFANQFDMIRSTDCLSLAPVGTHVPGSATMDAPIPRYRRHETDESGCLPSTEVGISTLALVADVVGDAMGIGSKDSLPLRMVAAVKVILLLLALAWVDRGMRLHAGMRTLHAWIAALVLVDPFNSLYFAGFYTEFAALLTAYLAVMLPLLWFLRARPPSSFYILIWGLVLGALAFSRFQHAVLPLFILVWLLWLAYRQGWRLLRLTLWPCAVLVAVLAVQLNLQSTRTAIGDANRWDSFFGAALPAAESPVDFVESLHLPTRCAQLVHSTWYLRRGRDAKAECPEAFSLSRVRWFTELAMHPQSLGEFVGRGVMLSGQWRPSYLGELAGQSYGRLPPGIFGLGASVADLVSRLPFVALCLFWASPILLAVLLVLRRFARNRARPRSDEITHAQERAVSLWLWPMLAMIVGLSWAASLVGDGYSELARHLHLAANASVVAALLLLVELLRALVRARSVRAIWSGEAAILVLGVVIAIFINHLLHGYMRLGFGVLDLPADESGHGQIALSGWAMDPRGVQAIDVVTDDGLRKALSLAPHLALPGIFGSGVGATGVSFSGEITVRKTASVAIRIEVTPFVGARTVIDRRWYRRVPPHAEWPYTEARP